MDALSWRIFLVYDVHLVSTNVLSSCPSLTLLQYYE